MSGGIILLSKPVIHYVIVVWMIKDFRYKDILWNYPELKIISEKHG